MASAARTAKPARRLLERIAFLEMLPNVLARALEPFPAPVRTLDALHLASIEFLRARGQSVELASYDDRLIAAARSLGIPIAALERPADCGFLVARPDEAPRNDRASEAPGMTGEGDDTSVVKLRRTGRRSGPPL